MSWSRLSQLVLPYLLTPYAGTPPTPPPGEAIVGDRPVHAAARELASGLHAGDETALRSFIRERAKTAPEHGVTEESLAELLVPAARSAQGVRVVQVRADDDRVTLVVRGEAHGRSARIRLQTLADGRCLVEGMPWRTPDEFSALAAAPRDRAAALRQVRRYLDERARADAWSGVVLVAQGDRRLLEASHGWMDRGLRVPMRPEARFDLASTGKMFTAVLIAQLRDEGKLHLDDPVGRYLPDYPDAATRAVTLRQLLNHTGGLGTVFGSPAYDPERRYRDARDLASALAGEPPAFSPGTRFSYSNGGFVLLGAVAEAIEGAPYRELVRRRIGAPLGMAATDQTDWDVVVPERVRIYDAAPNDLFGLAPKRLDAMRLGMGGGPHGGGHSTAADLLRFLRGLRGGRLVSPSTLAEFTTPAPTSADYALGFTVDEEEGFRVLGHNGHKRSDPTWIPELDLFVITMGNDLAEPAPVVGREIRRFLLRHADLFRSGAPKRPRP